jgi:hypothetical protein
VLVVAAEAPPHTANRPERASLHHRASWAVAERHPLTGVAKSGDEELDLVRLGDGGVVAGESHKSLGEVVHRAVAPQERQLVDRAVCQGWPESLVDQLDEVRPRWLVGVQLQSVVEQRVVGEVEQRVGDTMVVRSASDAEVLLTAIKPRQWIADAVVLGKLHLVCCREAFIILLVVTGVAVARRHTVARPLATFNAEQSSTQQLLLLALLCERGLDRSQLILQWNQQVHHRLDYLQAVDHFRHGDLLIAYFSPRPIADA